MGRESLLPAAPMSDLAPFTARHDWEFANYTLTSNPPQYDATCRRCGQPRRGWAESFQTNDCAGRIQSASSEHEEITPWCEEEFCAKNCCPNLATPGYLLCSTCAARRGNV